MARGVIQPWKMPDMPEYTFEVLVAGLRGYLWGRVIYNSDGDDSFYVSMDGGDSIIWHTRHGGTDTWVWNTVSQRHYSDIRDSSNSVIYNLEAGEHTLTIIFQKVINCDLLKV